MFKQIITREEALRNHPILAPLIVEATDDTYGNGGVSLEVEHDDAELPQPVEVGDGNWAKVYKGVPALKKALHDHGDSTVVQLVGQHEEMHGAGNMTAMKKLATEHLAKAIAHHTVHLHKVHSAIDAMPESGALKKLRKMAADHHDQTMDLHKTHHAEIHGSTSQQQARQLATEHLAKALTHHVDYFD